MRTLTKNLLALAATAALTLGMTAWMMEVADDGNAAEVIPACQTEDSDNCRWDAEVQGNGEGRSFTVTDGTVTYDDEAPADSAAPVPSVPGAPAAVPAVQDYATSTSQAGEENAPRVVNEDEPAGVVNENPDGPESCELGDGEVACGPQLEFDEGVLVCGTGAVPAIDQDRHGNWWAYCEPALVNEDGRS